MLDFYEKRRLRTICYSRPILAIGAVILLFMLYSVWGVYEKERETKERRDSRAAVLQSLEDRKQALETEVTRLETERGIEEEIRSKFDVAQAGEEVLVIVAPETETATEDMPEPAPSLWQRFKNIF